MYYVVDDDLHYDLSLRFATFAEALAEIRRLAALPWDDEDAQAPCIDWETCERHYVNYEYDDSKGRAEEVRQMPVATVSAQGVVWNEPVGDDSAWQEPSW